MGKSGIVTFLKESKTSYKIAAAIVFVLLLLTSIPLGAAFAGNQKSEESTYNYVSIGDSFTTGFGLPMTEAQTTTSIPAFSVESNPFMSISMYNAMYYSVRAPGAYPDLVVKALQENGKNVDYKQLAQAAMRTYDLRFLLDENYPADSFTTSYYLSAWKVNGVDYLNDLRAEYRSAIKDADLITYDLGKNEMSNYLLQTLVVNSTSEVELENILSEAGAEKYYACREQIHQLIDKYTEGEKTSETLATIERIVDTLVYAYVGFQVNYDKTLDLIYELNPDVQIMVLTLSSPMGEVNLQVGDFVLPVGTIMSSMCDMANLYILSASKHVDDVTIVDATDAEGYYTMLGDDVAAYQGMEQLLDGGMADFKYLCDYNASDLMLSSYAPQTILSISGDPDVAAYYEYLATFDYLNYDYNEYMKYYWPVYLKTTALMVEPEYQEALLYGYDSVARVMQSVLAQPSVPFDLTSITDIIGSFTGMGAYSEDYMNTPAMRNASTAYMVVAQAYQALKDGKDPSQITFTETEGGPEYTIDQYIQKTIDYVTSPEKITSAYIYFKISFGSTSGIHLGYTGHQQVADAIMSVYEDPCTQATYREMLKKVVTKYAEAYKECGWQFVKVLFDTISEKCAANRAELSALFVELANSDSSEEFIESLAKYLGLEGIAGIEKIEKLIGQAEDYYLAHPELFHVHSMKLVGKQEATCTQDGHRAYWQCKTCGKMYTDMLGANEIHDECEVASSATGHHYKFVKGIKIFRLVLIPDHYVCTTCGAVK